VKYHTIRRTKVNRTKIEWVKNPDGTQGYTWNPITGCLNGCEYCYARKLANGRLRARYQANENFVVPSFDRNTAIVGHGNADPFYPRFWPERLEIHHTCRFHRIRERQRYRDRGIFVCDMGELFGDWVPRYWQEQVFAAIQQCPNDRFYLLTKQPQNLIKFSPFPDNCWVGVTATESDLFAYAVNELMNIRATVKFVSIEPLLSWKRLDISTWLNQINWVIIGAQTKPYKPPKIEWVKEIVKAADKAGIPAFLKNNLMAMFKGSLFADEPWAFNEKVYKEPQGNTHTDWELRQGMPHA